MGIVRVVVRRWSANLDRAGLHKPVRGFDNYFTIASDRGDGRGFAER